MQYLADVAVLAVARDRYIAAVEGHAVAAEEEAMLQAEEAYALAVAEAMDANKKVEQAKRKLEALKFASAKLPVQEPPVQEPPPAQESPAQEPPKKRKRVEEVPCQRPVDPNKTPWGTVDNPLVNCQGLTFPLQGGAGATNIRCYYCTSCKNEDGQAFQFAVNCVKKRHTCMVCNKMKDDCECVLFKPYGLEPKLCKRTLDKSKPIRIVKCSVCGMAPKGTACICKKGGKKGGKGGGH